MPLESERLSPYDTIADLYDIEHADHGEDIALVRNIVSVVGDPVVEFGCGSGRLLIPVARDGFSITGVDDSSAMLDRARATIDAEDLTDEVTLVHGRMEVRLPLTAGTFGVGIFSLNGLMHLPSQEAQLAALTEACRLLDPRGQLLIDLFNPSPEYLTHLASGTHFEGAWSTLDDGDVEKWSHRTVRASRQEIDTRIWYDHVDGNGVVRRRRSSFMLRYIHASELSLMLQRAGFVEWQLYGSYELDPYDDASERLIALAERTPST